MDELVLKADQQLDSPWSGGGSDPGPWTPAWTGSWDSSGAGRVWTAAPPQATACCPLSCPLDSVPVETSLDRVRLSHYSWCEGASHPQQLRMCSGALGKIRSHHPFIHFSTFRTPGNTWKDVHPAVFGPGTFWTLVFCTSSLVTETAGQMF